MTTGGPSDEATEAALRGEWGEGAYSSSRRGGTRPWYRRRATIVALGVLVVLGVTIVIDLPTSQSRTAEIGSTKSFVLEAYGYLASCNTGIAEAYRLAGDVAGGHLSAHDLASANRFVSDDHLGCSETNNDVFELASISVPRVPKGTGTFASAVFSWVANDAFFVTGALVTLVQQPRNAAASMQLYTYQAKMTADRAVAASALATMGRELGTTLPALTLFRVPRGTPPLALPQQDVG